MTDLLLKNLESQQQMSVLFDCVFSKVCSMFELRLPKPRLIPVVTIDWSMVYSLDINNRYEADFCHRTPSIQYSIPYILKRRILGIDAAKGIAHELGHYARDACDLSPLDSYRNLTLRQLIARTIIEEGIAMAFENAYLKNLLSSDSSSLPLRVESLWHLSGLSSFLMDRLTTPLETWAHIHDIRQGGNPKITRYSFSGFRIYEYGRSEISRLIHKERLPMHRLLLSASEYIESKRILAAAAKIEKQLVHCTRKAFQNPRLTPMEVKTMLSET